MHDLCVRCIKGYDNRSLKCSSDMVLTGTDAQIVRPYNSYSSRFDTTDAITFDTTDYFARS